ncbi:MAG: PAS domain S-box protein [Ignavibacteriae bacterium]|nr:PAS domain S-box protein [Ignavibacteriota bacterium]
MSQPDAEFPADVGNMALRVLYLEDSEGDYELVSAKLRKEWFNAEVKWVNSERRFIAALSERVFDVILSDYDLPGYNAQQALRIAQERAPTTPFLCVSGAIGEETAVDLLKRGAKDYVSKFRLDRLSLAILRVLEEKSSLEARHAAEKALRESEYLYRSLFENMLNAFALCRMIETDGSAPDFIYITVNAAFERQTGLTDVVGRRLSEILPKAVELDLDLLRIYENVANTGAPQSLEYYIQSMGLWVNLSVYSPMPAHFAVVFDVINERKRAEKALVESETRFRALTEYSASWEAWFDAQGALVWMNNNAVTFTGYTPAEYIDSGDVFGMIVIEEDREKLQLAMQDALRGSSGDCLEIRAKCKDGGTIWVTVSWRPLYDGQGHFIGFRTSAHDVSDRIKANLKLQERMQEMQRFFNLTVDRELAMVAMKKEVNALLQALGKEAKYSIDE